LNFRKNKLQLRPSKAGKAVANIVLRLNTHNGKLNTRCCLISSIQHLQS